MSAMDLLLYCLGLQIAIDIGNLFLNVYNSSND